MQILQKNLKKRGGGAGGQKKPNSFSDFGTHPEFTTLPFPGNSSPSSKLVSQKKWSQEHGDQLHTFSYQTPCSIFEFLWLVDFKCWRWQ